MIERRAIHVHDLAAGELANEFPDSKSHQGVVAHALSWYADAPRGNSSWSHST